MNIFNRLFKKRNKKLSSYSDADFAAIFAHKHSVEGQEIILSYCDIIYVESNYQPHLNKYIVDNYDEIKVFFKYDRNDFIYLPSKKELLKELIFYNYPNISQDKLSERAIDAQIQDIYNFLYQSANNEAAETFCGLVIYNSRNGDTEPFLFYPLPHDTDNVKVISDSFKVTFKKKVNSDSSSINSLRFRVSNYEEDKSQDDYLADDYFSEESRELIKEVSMKIDQLEELGVSLMVLQKILLPSIPKKLSRIVITSEYRIFLPDYNNLEITMSPLPKAVFLLFLKYPEGILFKEIHDYKPELELIYEQISSREDMIKSKRSISDLTDPTKNSINEKCSRIREAFVRHFDDDIAKYYYITGERSMPKKIQIDRSLVEWQ